MKGRVVDGKGKEAEVGGGYFGGCVKPANLKEDRIGRHSSAPASPTTQRYMLTRPRRGMACMTVSK
jgi:hypothetical protein